MVVEHSTHYLKIKILNPADTAGIEKNGVKSQWNMSQANSSLHQRDDKEYNQKNKISSKAKTTDVCGVKFKSQTR
jgi:hypothetical protein